MSDDLYALELKIAKFLRTGVLVAGALLLVSWLGMIFTHTDGLSGFHEYREESLSLLWNRARQEGRWPVILSYLGLCSLISLPVLRVFLTSVLFFRQRERLLGFIALLVLTLLLISFSQGIEV
ncbi:MAG: DUF1634 domain-containing protein [Bdellovibrionota bacterium]